MLDNCEHLVDAAATLAEQLLQQCPLLRVLATSREPLAHHRRGRARPAALRPARAGHPGRVRRSTTPPSACSPTAPPPPGPDFVRRRRRPSRPVIEIVRRLDGLPLAIELAAARLRTLPVAEIAARLDDRFRLLTGGSRTALPRHRTLHAVVEWSWELLADAERRLVERLAVFAAGAYRDSAAAVCADDELPAGDVADLLSSLIDKSLLQRVGDGDRVRMLETIREFGIERLAERGELAAIRPPARRLLRPAARRGRTAPDPARAAAVARPAHRRARQHRRRPALPLQRRRRRRRAVDRGRARRLRDDARQPRRGRRLDGRRPGRARAGPIHSTAHVRARRCTRCTPPRSACRSASSRRWSSWRRAAARLDLIASTQHPMNGVLRVADRLLQRRRRAA